MDVSTINSDLIRGNVTTIILSTLSNGDRYGYEILKLIEEKSKCQYIIKQPTLYSCLKRLEKQNLIESYMGTSEDTSGGRRRYYALTDSGKEYFEKTKNEYEFSRTILDKLLSDRIYDLENETAPFDVSELRPYTKRNNKNKSNVKVVEKIVYVDRATNQKLNENEIFDINNNSKELSKINEVNSINLNDEIKPIKTETIISENFEDTKLSKPDINNANENIELKSENDIEDSTETDFIEKVEDKKNKIAKEDIINTVNQPQNEVKQHFEYSRKETLPEAPLITRLDFSNRNVSNFNNEKQNSDLNIESNKYANQYNLAYKDTSIDTKLRQKTTPKTDYFDPKLAKQRDNASKILGIGKYRKPAKIEIDKENGDEKSPYKTQIQK